MLKILCGMSGSGKDYTMRKMVNNGYIPIVSWTSRPMREGEIDGREYHFCDYKEFQYLIKNDKLIEYRSYNTLLNGKEDIWYYGTLKEKLDRDKDYVVILDLIGAKAVKEYYKDYETEVIYIYCDDNIRKERAKKRGGFDEIEWNRRLERDKIDFREEKRRGIVDKEVSGE